MKKTITLICMVFMCCMSLLNAQHRNSSSSQNKQTNPKTSAVKGSSVVRYEVKTEAIQIERKIKELFQKELENHSITYSSDTKAQLFTLSFDSSKVKSAEIQRKLIPRTYVLMPILFERKKDTIIVHDTIRVAISADTMQMPKYKPEIDKFLNIEDTTIFGSQFRVYDTLQIHHSRRSYYNLIKTLHALNIALKEAETCTSSSKITETVNVLKIPQEAAQKLLLESAKTQLIKADGYFKAIIPLQNDLYNLSDIQNQYYKALRDKLNNLDRKINAE